MSHEVSRSSSGLKGFMGALAEAENSVMYGDAMGEAIGLVIGGDNEDAIGLPFAAAVARSGSSTNARFNFFGGPLLVNGLML